MIRPEDRRVFEAIARKLFPSACLEDGALDYEHGVVAQFWQGFQAGRELKNAEDAARTPAPIPELFTLTELEIRGEIDEREQWKKRVDADPDWGAGGSPFEWHYERLEALDAELKRRGL